MSYQSPFPKTLGALKRRAAATTMRTLLFALGTLVVTAWGALLASQCLGIDSMALQFVSPLLTVYIVASAALGSWSKAWAALEPVSAEAFRWAVFQASQSEEAKSYLAQLLLLRRPMLQHDVWCLEEIQRNHTSPKNLAEQGLDAREQLTA